MAKKPRAGFATQSKSQNYSTKWLRNAMKSIGLSTNDVIKEISPNLYEVTSSGVQTSKNIVTSLRKNQVNTNKIGETLSSNKYVQFAQTAYKNALTDIKSGNLNNQDRASEAFEESMVGDIEELTDGLSFGDDGAESSVNVNVINAGDSGNSGALVKLSDQLSRNAYSQAKLQKANMDAYIAVGAANMQQIGQIGAEIVSQLTNVNNNLSALVQWNNENMNKFIEASMTYYDKAGASMDGSSENGGTSKITARDVLNSGSGGIKMSQYKSFVKQQFKDMVDNSDVGLLKSMFDDDMFLEMAASNPLGFLTTGLTHYMMPKVLKTSLETMETTFSNFMPTLLSQVADLAEDRGSSLMSSFRRAIGKTFGLKTDRIERMQSAEINRGAIPFDGETKHAITEIITKELREQTGYLQIIANSFDSNAKATMKKNSEYWSYNSNSYVSGDQLNRDIAQEIVDSITGAFKDTKFGQGMNSLVDSVKGKHADANKKEIQYTIDELFMDIEKSKKSLTLPDILALVENGGAGKNTKKIVQDWIRHMYNTDINSFQSVNTARIRSQGDANDAKKRIMENATSYHLNDTMFTDKDENGEIREIDDVVAEIMGYGKHSKNRRNVNKMKISGGSPSNIGGFSGNRTSLNGAANISGFLGNVTNQATGIMSSIMNGDTKGVIDQGVSIITDGIKRIGDKVGATLFGTKDDEGYSRNGIFSGINNGLSDMVNTMKWHITGKGYRDSKGNTIADKDDSVFSQFQKIGETVKDGIMLKLFGKEKNEAGEYVKSKDGIFGNIVNTFKSGFDGWTDAFFGTDEAEDPEKAREAQKVKISEYLKSAAPNGMTGAAIGAGVGMVSSGSLLGMMVGGPIAGAAMGAAVGLLSKNEKFQNWLFGEKDEETGERAGGLISQNVQKFFKQNKTYMAGSAAVGAVSGTITGGGLLGTLVGGPIAGALIGMAGGVVLKSERFQRFLFGDEESGQKGLIRGVKDAWSKHFKGKDQADVGAMGTKAIGMTTLGTAAGGLLGTIVGGPVLGSLAGFALSVKAQSGNFKEWLFGKEDGLRLGNGKRTKKQGVVGMIGNAINANIIKPMKTEFTFIAKDFMSTMEHKVLAPFAFMAEAAADKMGGIVSSIGEKADGVFSKINETISNTVGKLFSPITNAVGKAMEKGTDFAWKAVKHMMSTPGAIITATLKTLDLKRRFNELKPVKWVKALAKDVRDVILTGIKNTFKGIFNIIAMPFKGVGKLASTVGRGAKALGRKIADSSVGQKVKEKINGTTWMNNFKEALSERGETFGSLSERMKLNKVQYKQEQEEIKKQREENRRHDKNAKLLQKYSKGQFSEDTEEARTWMKYHNPSMYKKLQGTSITEEENQKKHDAEVAKNGRGTNGMDANQLGRANLNELNEEGKQTKLLFNIGEAVKAIVQKLQGKDISGHENDEERDEREANERAEAGRTGANTKARISQNYIKEGKYYINKNTGKISSGGKTVNIDDAPTKVRAKALEIMEKNGIITTEEGETPDSQLAGNRTGLQRAGDAVKSPFSNIKNYFKNNFFKHSRDLAKQSKAGRNPEEAAAALSEHTGERVESHSIGGIIKKGLSLVGEKGAELLNLTDEGAEVLNSEDTEKAVDDALKSKKRKHKLSNLFKKKREEVDGTQASVAEGMDNALEEQSDESRVTRLKNAMFMLGKARTKKGQADARKQADMARLEHDADMRADSQEKALENAKSADQLRKEREEEKYRKQVLDNQSATIDALHKSNDGVNKFKDLWSSIFSKKGLITAAALLGYAWLKKHLPGLFDTINGILSAICKFVGGTVKETVKDIAWTEKNDARTDGNTMAEQAEKNIQDIKDGNILTDSEGNVTHNTNSRWKFLARTGMNFINSGFKTPGSKIPGFIGKNAKIANAEKGAFNLFKKIGNGAQNIGTKMFGKSEFEKVTGNLVGNGMSFLDDSTRALSATDFAKLTEGMDDTEKALFKAQNGFEVLDDTEGVGRKLITKVKNTKVGKAVGNTIDNIGSKVSKVKNGAASLADNVASSVKNSKIGTAVSEKATTVKSAIKAGGDDMAKAIAEKATKNDGLLSKVCGYIDELFKFVQKKFAAKAGKEVAEGAFKIGPAAIAKSLKAQWTKVCTKLAEGIAAATGKGVSAAAVSFGLSEVVFATFGAIDGVSGTAKLFQVPSDQVDGNMRLIAGIFGALTGTTLGSILDVILTVVGDIMGCDILHSMAVSLYKVMVGSDSDKAKALDDAQADWQKAYLDKRDEKIEEQYNTQKKAGIIGEDVTYEMFAEGLKDGTYSASYESFQDFNARENASFGDKIIGGIGKGFKGTKNAIVDGWQGLFGGKETFTDDKGNTYTKNHDGTYQVKSADGEDLGYVNKDAIDLDSMKKEKSKGLISKAGEKIASGAKNLWSNAKSGAKKLWGNVKEGASNLVGKAKETAKSAATWASNKLSETKDNIVKGVKNIGKGINWLLEKKTEEIYRATDGSYYKPDGTHYSANGDKMDSISITELSQMIASGILTQDELVTKEAGWKQILNKGKETLSKAWNGAVDGLKEKWNSLKDGAKKLKDSVIAGAKKVGSNVKAFFTDTQTEVYYASDGSYYMADGTHYSATGDKIEDTITEEELTTMISNGTLTKGTIEKEAGWKTTLKTVGSTLKSGWEKATGALKSAWDGFTNKVSKVKDVIVGKAKEVGSKVKSFFVDTETEVYYASDGSYYKAEGETYGHYTATGEKINDEINTDEISEMISNGTLTKGTIEKEAGWKTTLKTVGSTLKSGWEKATGALKSAWDGFKGKISKGAEAIGRFTSKAKEGLKNFFISKTETVYFSDDGSYYKPAGETFEHYTANGDKINEEVDAEAVSAAIASGALTEGTVEGDPTWKATIKSIGSKISASWTKATTSLSEGWESIKSKAGAVMDDIKKAGGVGKWVGGLFKSTTTQVWYDTDGCYYKLESNGKYTYYNINGDVLKEDIDAETVEDLQKQGLVHLDDLIEDSKAKEAIKSIKGAVSDAWDKAKDTVKSGWESFKGWITGGSGGSGETSFDKAKNIQKSNHGGSGRGIMRKPGGFGEPETMNGASYFAQTDSRWADAAYNMGADSATMGTTGCGPTAMAMAVNTAKNGNGNSVTPMDMANIAKITGNRDDTGTNWNFINQSAGMVGVNSMQELNPSARDIDAQVSTGNPVVLSGMSSGGSDPYTSAGHYVVAVGKNSNGDILVNDPRGKSYSKAYNVNDIARNTGSSWMISDPSQGGFGAISNTLRNRRKMRRGGRGKDWLSIVAACKKSIGNQKKGYSQSGYIDVTVDGKTYNTRRDCSGFVSVCLTFYTDKKILTSSYGFGNESWVADYMKAAGFSKMNWPGWSGVKAGDIFCTPSSHVEICAQDGAQRVYNCGSDSSCNNPGITGSDHSSYTYIWRPGDPGTGGQDLTVGGGTASFDGASTSSDTTTNESKLGKLTSYLGSFFSEFSNRAITGDFSNTDYSNLLSSSSSSYGDATYDGASTTSSMDSAVSSGNSTARKGETVTLPSGLGTKNSYMGWQCITSPSSIQYKLRQQAGQKFNEQGYGHINGRYTVATTQTYGNVGDYIDIKRSDGSTLKAIIADIKSQGDPGCNKWGHQNGDCVVEFVVDKSSWYASDGRGIPKGYTWLNQTDPGKNKNPVVSITNQGSYFSGGSGTGIPNKLNNSASLSKRDRYVVNRARKRARGGYGPSIDSSNSIVATTKSATQFSAKDYISTSKDNSIKELFINAIEILASIAGSSAETSSKLNALKEMNFGTNNTIVNADKNISVSNSNNMGSNNSQASARNNSELTARAIARGGY